MKTGLSKNDSLSIKGIAVMMLVFHHLFCEVGRFEKYVIDFSPFGQDIVVDISFMFKTCVSIFAFITGYGLLKSIKNVKLNTNNVFKWNVNRLVKTMSGFWIIYILSFIVTMLINKLPATKYLKDGLFDGIIYAGVDFLGLANLFGTPTLCGTWWYMTAAIIFIVSVPLIYGVRKKVGYMPVLLMLFAVPRLFSLGDSATGYLGGLSTFTFITPVIFGMIFADYDLFEKISEKAPKNKAVAYILHLAFFGILTLISAVVCIKIDRTKFWEISYGFVPVVYICFFRYCIIRIPVIKQILSFLGKHSMTLFLTHTFMRANYLPDFIYGRGHFVLIFITFFMMSLALALVIDLFLALIRYDKLISKLLKKFNEKTA